MISAQVTIPYYRTTNALVFKPGGGLEGVTALNDPKLRDKRIGIVAGTPPGTNMAINGLMAHAKPYPLMIDTRLDSSAQAMSDDLARRRHRLRDFMGTDGGLLRQTGDAAVDRHLSLAGRRRLGCR